MTTVKPQMRITFIGTGEAGDPHRRNTSVLITTDRGEYLLDCGFSSAMGYLAHRSDTPLTGIWISHLHGDHFFGIPQLLVAFYTQERREPLQILSGVECREAVTKAVELAYPGLLAKLGFDIHFTRLVPGTLLQHAGLDWRGAPVHHSQQAYGLRLDGTAGSLYYSGDGKPTAEAMELISGCDLVIHEAFSFSEEEGNHCSVEECLRMARDLPIARLALVHLNRETREMSLNFGDIVSSDATAEVLIAGDGESFTIS